MSGLCKECVSGVTHEGTPVGKVEKWGDIDVYVAVPPEGVEYAKDKAVLFFTGKYSYSNSWGAAKLCIDRCIRIEPR